MMKTIGDKQNKAESISRLKSQHKATKENQKLWRHYSSQEETPLSDKLLTEVQKRLNKAHRPQQSIPKSIKFTDLFHRADQAQKVKEILERAEIIIKGVYKTKPERSNNKSELLACYYVLRPIMTHHRKTEGARCFYEEFGATELILSDRMLRTEPFNNDRDRFAKLFAQLLPSK